MDIDIYGNGNICISLPIEGLWVRWHFGWAFAVSKNSFHLHVSNRLEKAKLVAGAIVKATAIKDGFRILERWIGRFNFQGSIWVANVEISV